MALDAGDLRGAAEHLEAIADDLRHYAMNAAEDLLEPGALDVLAAGVVERLESVTVMLVALSDRQG